MSIRLLSLLCLFWLGVFSTALFAADRPERIVSINLCTDQLLLLLVAPERIASVSHLSLDPQSSYMHAVAQGHRINHGQTEELLTLKPDLILAGSHAARSTVTLLRALDYPVELFPMAQNIGEIRQSIRRLAARVDEVERGKQLIAHMDRRILAAQAEVSIKPSPGAMFYQPRGYTSGSQTLQDEALRIAGWRNVASELGVVGFGAIDLERLLLAGPEQLFSSRYSIGTESIAERHLHHPALQPLLAQHPIREIPYHLWICGGPMIAEAIEQLAQARREYNP